MLILLVLNYSALNALVETRPDAAADVARRHPERLLREAFRELQVTGQLNESTEQAALDAFRRSPLSEVPLLIAARQAAAQDDLARADRLVGVAARRNPRSRYILLLELEQHLRNGRVREAAATMGVLTRFFSDVGPFLVAELGRMAADPSARPAVRHVMETDPRLRSELLEQLARDGADPAMILDLAGRQPPLAAGSPAPLWQRLLLDGMVSRGQVEQAFRLWQRFADAGETAVGTIYDPEFRGLVGPAPFNWSYSSGAEAVVGPAGAGGGLQALYYGRRAAPLAAQLLRLAPGSYRIAFQAEGKADGEHGRLAWTIGCHPGGRSIAEVPIVGVDFGAKRFSETFVVPDLGCPGQWLRLAGTAHEFPQDQEVTIRGLQIEAATP